MAIAGNRVTTAKIDADAVTGAKVADDTLDSEHYVAASIDNEHLADNAVGTDEIAADAVTYAKIQNVSATDKILGRDSASAGIIEEITPANVRTMLNVEDGATADQSNAEIVAAVEAGTDSNTFTDADHTKLNGITASANAYVHPNHSGEVTSTADGATVIAGNIVDEANMKISNAPTNGHFLSAQSGDTGGMTWAVTNASEMGTQHMWIPAAAIRPRASNPCDSLTDVETTANRPDIQVLDFDASAAEFGQFTIAMPSSWNEGTITYQVYWTTTAADTDGVAWGLQGVCISDNDTMDVAYGTAVIVTDDALGAAEDLMVTAASGATTLAGSPAAGDLAAFQIYRAVADGNDDMTEDARLIGIKIIYTTDASTDS